MTHPRRALTPRFKEDLKNGILSRLLQLVLQDRDLLLEIRSGYIDLYFKGNGLIKIEARQANASEYRVSTHEKFANDLAQVPLKDEQDVQELIRKLPDIKHQISIHKPYASEIEIEHFLIRMNNRERDVNSEYFAVDRQGIYGPNNDRIDVLGIYWGRTNRSISVKVDLCFIEVKFAMGAKIGDVATQLQRYYDILCNDLPQVAADAQALLRDKIDLGLLGTNKRMEKLKQLKVSDRMEDVRCVVVLAEQNPFSKSFKPQSLSSLPFSKIEIFRVGFGLWSSDAYQFENGEWRRPAVFGPTI